MQKRDKYSLYVRKSRKDMELEAIGQGETLARHKAELLALAEAQGLKVVKIYEEMVSGESIAARPQMQQLLDEVYAGTYAGVLVMEVERLARGNTKDQGEVAEAFAMSNTLIITPSKTYDPNNEFDEEYFEFGLFMSRREYKTIRRRMQRGIMASIHEGNFVGASAPYGYDAVRYSKKDRRLVPNDKAENVVMMFDWFIKEGLSCGAIARRLTSMGIPTIRGGSEWSRTGVKEILQNVTYTGKTRWAGRKTVKEISDGKTIKRRRRSAPEDAIIVEGKHKALISQDTFDKAQTLFSGKIPAKFNTIVANPFAGLLACKNCGKIMVYDKCNKPDRRTLPRLSHSASTLCKVKSSRCSDVIEAVVQGLREYIADFEFKLNNNEAKRQAQARAEMIDAMSAELRKLEQTRERLFDFFESGIYTKDEFIERKAAITDKITTLEANIQEVRDHLPPPVDYQEKILKFSEVIAALQDEDVPAKEKNELMKSIIERIEYDCIDLGRQKGGNIILDIHLKN